jgi:hypothetical protein
MLTDPQPIANPTSRTAARRPKLSDLFITSVPLANKNAAPQ